MNRRTPQFIIATLLALGGCAADPPMLPQPETQSYRLGAGDHIRVITYDESQLTNNFTVAADGSISFPLIGTVQSAGLPPNQLAADIAAELKQGQYITSPSVSVQVNQYRPISVLGEVNHPGQYPYQPGMTMLNAVALAGGFTYRAVSGNALDLRATGQDTPIQGQIVPSSPLQPGDIITISERYF
jgi:polysaccharide export outer membrane protein